MKTIEILVWGTICVVFFYEVIVLSYKVGRRYGYNLGGTYVARWKRRRRVLTSLHIWFVVVLTLYILSLLLRNTLGILPPIDMSDVATICFYYGAPVIIAILYTIVSSVQLMRGRNDKINGKPKVRKKPSVIIRMLRALASREMFPSSD